MKIQQELLETSPQLILEIKSYVSKKRAYKFTIYFKVPLKEVITQQDDIVWDQFM